MLGIDYGSDSEDETSISPRSSSVATKTSGAPGLSNKLALPPPINLSSSTSSKDPTLPPSKTKKAAGPKKIVVGLPKFDKHGSDDELSDEMPAAKKPKLGGERKAGASSLLNMLPAPKKSTLDLPAPQRVLGGGKPGVMYSAASKRSREQDEPRIVEDANDDDEDDGNKEDLAPKVTVKDDQTTTSMIPPSMLLKGKTKIRTPAASKPSSSTTTEPSAPPIDFFSLVTIGSTSSTRVSAAPSIPDSSGLSSSIPSTISSAPKIEEFQPASPKMDDPYPGYYQLPSGAWAMHDSEYYKTYADRWQREYEAQIRAYEREQKGFEDAGANGENATEVSAAELADAARAAREEKKALTQRAGREVDPSVPKAALNPTKLSGVARSRHQLHSLLADAYLNRETLEEKIAQGRRNRKEAGNKYGF